MILARRTSPASTTSKCLHPDLSASVLSFVFWGRKATAVLSVDLFRSFRRGLFARTRSQLLLDLLGFCLAVKHIVNGPSPLVTDPRPKLSSIIMPEIVIKPGTTAAASHVQTNMCNADPAGATKVRTGGTCSTSEKMTDTSSEVVSCEEVGGVGNDPLNCKLLEVVPTTIPFAISWFRFRSFSPISHLFMLRS